MWISRKKSLPHKPTSCNGLGNGMGSFLQVAVPRVVSSDGHGLGLRILVTRRTLAEWGLCCRQLMSLLPGRPKVQGKWLMVRVFLADGIS